MGQNAAYSECIAVVSCIVVCEFLSSADSGKGTSTGSSRPSSQVISVDTEDGMRQSRSWSLGKNNSVSPLADQITPAHRHELAEGNRMIVNETNGKHHYLLYTSQLLSISHSDIYTTVNVMR